MSSMLSALSYAVSYTWPVVLLAVGVMALVRFRATAAGLCIGGAMIGTALRVLALTVYYALSGPVSLDEGYLAVQIVSLALNVAMLALLTVGIAMIPASLRKLGVADATRPKAF